MIMRGFIEVPRAEMHNLRPYYVEKTAEDEYSIIVPTLTEEGEFYGYLYGLDERASERKRIRICGERVQYTLEEAKIIIKAVKNTFMEGKQICFVDENFYSLAEAVLVLGVSGNELSIMTKLDVNTDFIAGAVKKATSHEDYKFLTFLFMLGYTPEFLSDQRSAMVEHYAISREDSLRDIKELYEEYIHVYSDIELDRDKPENFDRAVKRALLLDNIDWLLPYVKDGVKTLADIEDALCLEAGAFDFAEILTKLTACLKDTEANTIFDLH